MATRVPLTITALECDTCKRSSRVPTNTRGITTTPTCNLTLGCKGTLSPVTNPDRARSTPTIPPDVPGVLNWSERKILQTHNQPVTSSKWTFKYELSGTPAIHVFVYDSDDNLVETMEFSHTISNQKVTILLPVPMRGVVQCVTASPATLFTDATPTTSNTMQISSDYGDITIATLDAADSVGVTIVFTPQGNTVPIEYFGIDTNPSITSPWINVHAAVVNGRKYYVRSFNIHTAASAVEYFSTGIIPSGTPLYFSVVGARPIIPGSSVLLLGNPPYNFVDRVYDKIIDVSSVAVSSSPVLYYADGKVYSTVDVSKHTYPAVLIL